MLMRWLLHLMHLPPLLAALRLPTLVAPRSLSAALRCDGTPLPAATILLLMVLLRMNTSQGHPPKDSAQLCHSRVRPVWFSARALLKNVEEQQRLHFDSTVRRAAPCTTSCCPPWHVPSPCSPAPILALPAHLASARLLGCSSSWGQAVDRPKRKPRVCCAVSAKWRSRKESAQQGAALARGTPAFFHKSVRRSRPVHPRARRDLAGARSCRSTPL